jgi:hypothetical protein
MSLMTELAARFAASFMAFKAACPTVEPGLADVRPAAKCNGALRVLLDDLASAQLADTASAIAIEAGTSRKTESVPTVTDLSARFATSKTVGQSAGKAFVPLLYPVFRPMSIIGALKTFRWLEALASTGAIASSAIAVGRSRNAIGEGVMRPVARLIARLTTSKRACETAGPAVIPGLLDELVSASDNRAKHCDF